MSVIILDLDGTISDDRWRQEYILADETFPPEIPAEEANFYKYHHYHSLLAWDDCANEHLFRDTRHQIVIFTVRPKMYFHLTMEWLRRKGVPHIALVMRDDTDIRASETIKEDMLLRLREAHFEATGNKGMKIERAYDDNEAIVQMYRKNGVKSKLITIG